MYSEADLYMYMGKAHPKGSNVDLIRQNSNLFVMYTCKNTYRRALIYESFYLFFSLKPLGIRNVDSVISVRKCCYKNRVNILKIAQLHSSHILLTLKQDLYPYNPGVIILNISFLDAYKKGIELRTH